MKKLLSALLVVLIAGFLVVQFIPGAPRDNPPALAPAEFPPAVYAVMRDACLDCHSNETSWPWYSGIAPMKWYVARDVHRARSHLNFSNWGALPPETRLGLLAALWDGVVERRMPHKPYALMHPKVELAAEERKLIRDWSFGQVAELTREMDSGGNR